VRRVLLSRFALPNTFFTVPSASILFSRFALPISFSTELISSGLVFTFSAPRYIFGGTEGVGYCFHVLRSRTHFRRYRVRRLPLSRFALTDTFSVVPSALGLVFTFCVPRLIFGRIEHVESRFHVLRSRTRFRRYRARWVPFPRFAPPPHFRRYRARRLPFDRFALPKSFLTVPRASSLVLTFCAPWHISTVPSVSAPVITFYAHKHVFCSTELVESHFHVFLSRSNFQQYRSRRVPFSRFLLPNTFLAIISVLGPIFTFCAPGLVFGCIEHVGSRFHVFDCTEHVGSCFLVLRFRTYFRR